MWLRSKYAHVYSSTLNLSSATELSSRASNKWSSFALNRLSFTNAEFYECRQAHPHQGFHRLQTIFPQTYILEVWETDVLNVTDDPWLLVVDCIPPFVPRLRCSTLHYLMSWTIPPIFLSSQSPFSNSRTAYWFPLSPLNANCEGREWLLYPWRMLLSYDSS